jgi:uncharacterized protein YjbI with pentapeptide repeats
MVKHLPIYMNSPKSLALVTLIVLSFFAGTFIPETYELNQENTDLMQENTDLMQENTDLIQINTDALEENANLSTALIELEHYRNLSISEIEFLKLEINKTIIDINYEIEQNQENMQIINNNNIYYSNLLSERDQWIALRDQQLIQLRGDLNEERDALNSKNSTISDLEFSLIEIQQLVSYWNNMYNESKISLSGSDLIGINLICYDYGLITMPPRQCQLNHAVLSGANLTGANMYNVNLSEANLFNANLNGVNMDYVNLDGARLHFADLTNARVINLLGCPIQLPTNWTCTANSLIGPFANLSNAILSNINAQSMYLNNIDFSNSSLIMADFYNSNMRHSNLSNANLTGAYFRNAHLAFADLSGADLSGADLSNVYLAEANLFGADLTNANLNSASWGNSICPDGTNSNNNGNTCVNNL